MGKLKDIYTIFNQKELEKQLKEIKRIQDNCKHDVPFYEDLKKLGYSDDYILSEYRYCSRCALKVVK